MATRQHGTQQLQALRRRDQNTHIAVLQDVSDLLRLEQRIHRHEYATSHRRTEQCNHGIDAFFHVHGYAFTAVEAESEKKVSGNRHRLS